MVRHPYEDAWIASVSSLIYNKALGNCDNLDILDEMGAAIAEVKAINEDGTGFTIRWHISENEERESENVMLDEQAFAEAVSLATERFQETIRDPAAMLAIWHYLEAQFERTIQLPPYDQQKPHPNPHPEHFAYSDSRDLCEHRLKNPPVDFIAAIEKRIATIREDKQAYPDSAWNEKAITTYRQILAEAGMIVGKCSA